MLEVDEFGNEKKSAAIGYGRRYEDPDPLLTAPDHATQCAKLVTYTESDYTNAVSADDAYRSRLPADVRTYELTGYTPRAPPGAFKHRTSSRRQRPVSIWFSTANFHASPPQPEGEQRRLIKQLRVLYRSDDLQNALPLGTVESLALPFQATS